jgi:hypothetical protein
MYYIGVHSGHGIDDGYLGSGKAINAAIKKHGRENFRKEILEVCSSRDDADKAEQRIVNHDIINDLNSYNLILGGRGIFALNHKKRKGFLQEFDDLYFISEKNRQKPILWRSETERYIFVIDHEKLLIRDKQVWQTYVDQDNQFAVKIFEVITSREIYKKIAKDMGGFYNDLNKEHLYNYYLNEIFVQFGMIEFCSFKVVTIKEYERYLSENKSNA